MSTRVVPSRAAKRGGELWTSVGGQDGIGLLQRLLTWLQEVKSQSLSDVLAVTC